jgi:hypothetical protein
VGLPRTYVSFVCLSLDTHFAETGPGSAAQLAAYWEVFRPGPPTSPRQQSQPPGGGVISRSLYPDAEMSSVPVPRFRQAPQGPRDLDRLAISNLGIPSRQDTRLANLTCFIVHNTTTLAMRA